MSPKNYSVKNLTKEDDAEVQAVLKANPNWKLKHARERVAMRKFQQRIEAAGQPPMVCKRCGALTPPISPNSREYGTLCQACTDWKATQYDTSRLSRTGR